MCKPDTHKTDLNRERPVINMKHLLIQSLVNQVLTRWHIDIICRCGQDGHHVSIGRLLIYSIDGFNLKETDPTDKM